MRVLLIEGQKEYGSTVLESMWNRPD
jgi:hypothetical protein